MGKFGRWAGRTMRRVGNLASSILKPLSQVSASVAPVVASMAPMAGPYAPALTAAATLAPSVLKAAGDVSGVIGSQGAQLASSQ